MEIADMFIELGEAAKVLQQEMTLENAIDLIDPGKMYDNEKPIEIPSSRAAFNALMTKAHVIVANYAREQLAKEKKNEN